MNIIILGVVVGFCNVLNNYHHNTRIWSQNSQNMLKSSNCSKICLNFSLFLFSKAARKHEKAIGNLLKSIAVRPLFCPIFP